MQLQILVDDAIAADLVRDDPARRAPRRKPRACGWPMRG
jgi:hypothetical protein